MLVAEERKRAYAARGEDRAGFEALGEGFSVAMRPGKLMHWLELRQRVVGRGGFFCERWICDGEIVCGKRDLYDMAVFSWYLPLSSLSAGCAAVPRLERPHRPLSQEV